MIIELKGLPKQKIKKINFNIEFDENYDGKDEDTYEVNINSPVSQNKQSTTSTKQEDLSKTDNDSTSSHISGISDISDRAPKEIPAEMLEESF